MIIVLIYVQTQMALFICCGFSGENDVCGGRISCPEELKPGSYVASRASWYDNTILKLLEG